MVARPMAVSLSRYEKVLARAKELARRRGLDLLLRIHLFIPRKILRGVVEKICSMSGAAWGRSRSIAPG